jgi:hypothetical protein
MMQEEHNAGWGHPNLGRLFAVLALSIGLGAAMWLALGAIL